MRKNALDLLSLSSVWSPSSAVFVCPIRLWPSHDGDKGCSGSRGNLGSHNKWLAFFLLDPTEKDKTWQNIKTRAVAPMLVSVCRRTRRSFTVCPRAVQPKQWHQQRSKRIPTPNVLKLSMQAATICSAWRTWFGVRPTSMGSGEWTTSNRFGKVFRLVHFGLDQTPIQRPAPRPLALRFWMFYLLDGTHWPQKVLSICGHFHCYMFLSLAELCLGRTMMLWSEASIALWGLWAMNFSVKEGKLPGRLLGLAQTSRRKALVRLWIFWVKWFEYWSKSLKGVHWSPFHGRFRMLAVWRRWSARDLHEALRGVEETEFLRSDARSLWFLVLLIPMLLHQIWQRCLCQAQPVGSSYWPYDLAWKQDEPSVRGKHVLIQTAPPLQLCVWKLLYIWFPKGSTP